MDLKYETWIKVNYPDGGYGKCSEAVQKMCVEFPELKTERGHYYCAFWGERSHWWCVDSEGKIVDPTAGQFPSKGFGHYEPLSPDDKIPSGVCPECGEHLFDGSYVHAECESSYLRYINSI